LRRQRTDTGFGEAEAQMRAAGLEPLAPYPGILKPWRCRCATCGREVNPPLASIRHRGGGCRYCAGRAIVRNGTGCRFCAEQGIDFAAPGIVYLLHHQGFGAYKVGIANQTSGRTQHFASAAWKTFRTYPTATADEAYRVEQAVLTPYRATSLCPFLTRAELPNGFSETIDAEAVSLLDLWAALIAAAETGS
jgi:DNA-directed RNA polymerase subunit RPC12/RpoP